MTTAVPPLPPELQARLDEIMARRPKDGRVCASHWLMLNQPPGCVEVQSCACHDLTIPERRLIRQYERGEQATADADVQGLDDNRASKMLALHARATNEAGPKWTAEEQSLLDNLERLKRRPLSREEQWLALEQARAMGMLE